eukprot:scaffold282288_cov33-Tisochrysis_lutea.AAC.1
MTSLARRGCSHTLHAAKRHAPTRLCSSSSSCSGGCAAPYREKSAPAVKAVWSASSRPTAAPRSSR